MTLTVRPGERRALIGPNGAGKTTLFNLIAGAMPVSSGRIALFGRDVTHAPAHRRAALGPGAHVPDHQPLPRSDRAGELPARGAGAHAGALLDVPPGGRATRPCSSARGRRSRRLELEKLGDAVVRNLSHGEQRQLEIALALAGQPRVLLLDEPTAGLSPAESRLMAGLLRRLDPAITVLMIEHDMDIALELVRHVTVLHYGRVIADGPREQVRPTRR